MSDQTAESPIAATLVDSKSVSPASPYGCIVSVAVTFGRLIAHGIAGLALFYFLCSPYLGAMNAFVEFETPVPEMTVKIENWARWLNKYWLIAIPLAMALDAAILSGLQLLPERARWLASAWFSVVLIATILILALAASAIAIPLSHMRPLEDPGAQISGPEGIPAP